MADKLKDADALKDYEVTEKRFIGGLHREIGDPVQMTECAAKYYVAPYGTGLKLAVPSQEPSTEPTKVLPAEKANTKSGNKPGKTES